MSNKLPLPKEKKLTVVIRLEAGCLGPDGEDHVEEFCHYAQKEVESIDSDFVHWEIMPRPDKDDAETEYRISNKNLSHDKAAKYLELFNRNLDEFEEHVHDKLIMLIEGYMEQ